ncbi:hypothetical protein Daus18300_011746 [Diaporthe australafricana]|uniref:Uncharacterized protein n=1 Tax=Diaporthe australafricana TaxID=127596 RepID=A0ABR3W5J1_9PEZI
MFSCGYFACSDDEPNEVLEETTLDDVLTDLDQQDDALVADTDDEVTLMDSGYIGKYLLSGDALPDCDEVEHSIFTSDTVDTDGDDDLAADTPAFTSEHDRPT